MPVWIAIALAIVVVFIAGYVLGYMGGADDATYHR